LLKKISKYFPFLSIEHGPWVAGGFVRKLIGKEYVELTNGDIDIFCRNKETFDFVMKYIYDHKGQADYKTSNGTMFKIQIDGQNIPVNVVHKEFESIVALLQDFDLSVCQFAMDNDGIYYIDPESLSDLWNKVLRPTRPTQMFRVAKYLRYGFVPTTLNQLGSHDDIMITAKLDDKRVYYSRSDEGYLQAHVHGKTMSLSELLYFISDMKREDRYSGDRGETITQHNQSILQGINFSDEQIERIKVEVNEFLGQEFIKL
jgi:hypothetical protein